MNQNARFPRRGAKRTTAREYVYANIRKWIIEGSLQEGEKISDAEIAEYFGVSRTPVREAFQRLESQNLIHSYPGNATLVTRIDRRKLEKLYEPMAVLQELAVRTAIPLAKDQDAADLGSLAERFREAVRDRENVYGILTADIAFHQKINALSQNEYIESFCDTLWIHIARLDYCFFRSVPDTPLDASIAEHGQLVDCFRRQDPKEARKVILAHWNRTLETVRDLPDDRTAAADESSAL